MLANLSRIGFQGDIHLVSRSNREIGGRACVGSIDELPDGVDVAVLAVPRQATVDAVQACVRRKIGAALVFASGFAEMDDAGRAEQDAMARIANEAKLALCGPNCIGLVNLTDRVALTFEPLSLPAQVQGRGIGVVTQSGAMCSTLRLALLAKGLKLSIVVSTGNEAQLTTEHFLEFLIDDDATEVIVLFMEQVRDPALFLELAARARERKKPIVLMHPGRSARAQESARTHTGAMVGNHAVMSALVAHQAVVRVETLEELLDTAEILARFAAPPVKGAAVMTNSGAFKGYALDFAETLGLESAGAVGRECRSHQENSAAVRGHRKSGRHHGADRARSVDPGQHRGAASRRSGDGLSSSSRSSPARRALPWTKPTRSCPASPISKSRSRSPPWATRPNCRRNFPQACATRGWRSSARRIVHYAPWRGRPGTATP